MKHPKHTPWNPNPKVIEYLTEEAKKNPGGRLSVGRRILTLGDALQEIQSGTPFGQNYHNAIEDSLLKRRSHA